MIFDGITVTSLSFIGGSVSVFWLVAAFSVFVVAITKSGFGGSMGALSAPIMLTVLPPDIALAVLLPLYLLADVWTIYISGAAILSGGCLAGCACLPLSGRFSAGCC